MSHQSRSARSTATGIRGNWDTLSMSSYPPASGACRMAGYITFRVAGDETSREPCGEKKTERQDLATEGLRRCGVETSSSQRQGVVDNDHMDVHMPPTPN